ncbi:MAG: GTPase ObgE [Bacteroidetes Order II. Incertae sedis bacterium]|jgi:GTPase|nr:GTPase ObgE [Bacteroidetes Order II. bacterium]MBT4051522.1 GTPase ObgE [Bacteroidetes Order II. bacterium]MBT5250148.1 GTPase ObgE [Bacteroidetes Order II. bacterium]MBT6201877.1 GTPase ObgE [Bacteroidetes Order II. bacterium]MBT6424381.1 GTPase ObgE [Bacteroidetes Order II. bacterium]
MKFVDYVTISIRSGKGGSGRVAFRREKYEPMGGPNGGDGGDGGSVTMVAESHLYTLLDHRYNRHQFAGNGESGGSSLKKGKDGDNILLRVPVGTVIKNSDTGLVIGELLVAGESIELAKGGRGGKGNTFFKSATNRTPRHAQPGEPGEEFNITLELKLLADVGLVGFPNAGKSTLVASLSAARPKIADYPFTTLAPSLGVVSVGDFESFVIADIPGIIEGAHEGKGLGIQFLKHIERNAVLLFMVPVTSEDIGAEYETLLNELREFDARMLEKPRMVGISKTDLLPADELAELLKEARSVLPDDVGVLAFSSVAHMGLKELKREMWNHVNTSRSFGLEEEGISTS